GDTDLLVFYAPWAQYLEVLDPLPMSLTRPDAYQAKLRIWEGTERDVPRALATTLDSDYLVASRLKPEQAGLCHRLMEDPRIEILHDGLHLLARWVPGANERFVRDWRVAPAEVADATWTEYPWAREPGGPARG